MELNTKKWYITWDGKNIFMIAILLLLPLVTSIVSTWHVIDFLQLANNPTMAITLAGTFEAGLLAALAAMQIMRIIESKWAIYVIFIILTFYQLIGNVYYGYNYISENMTDNPMWINNFVELFQFIHEPEDIIGWKRIISIVAGAILPVASMIFLHICMEYILAVPKKVELVIEEDHTSTQPSEEKTVFNENSLNQKQTEFLESQIEKVKSDLTLEKEVEQIVPLAIPSVEPAPIQVEQEDEISLTEEEINEVKQQHEENLQQINDIKADLKNSEEENVYLKFLNILYNDGKLTVGDEIPAWDTLLTLIREKDIKVSENEIKQFLILCNILKITDMTDKKRRIVKKTLEQAKQVMTLLLSNM